jgi:hypothetical protein
LGPTYYNALQEYLDALSQAEQRIDLVVARMDDHYSRELKAWEAHKGLRKALAKEIGE